MNTTDEIIKILQRLEQGQKTLEQNQRSLEQRQKLFEQNQKLFEQNQKSLEQGQNVIVQKIFTIEKTLGSVITAIETLQKGQDDIREQLSQKANKSDILDLKAEVIRKIRQHEKRLDDGGIANPYKN